MILDYLSSDLFVHVISNVLMSIVITYIMIGVSKTILNGLVELLSHLLRVMFPLLRPLLSVKYVVPHMYALLYVILKYYKSTPQVLECLVLALILVYMIIIWPMTHVVKHWTWYTSALQMKY